MISYIKHLQYSKFLQIFFIILLCFIIYTPSLRNGFVWDDGENISKSPWIQERDALKVIWFTNKMYQYYPVDFTTFWLEHKLWGLNPFGYHTTNLIFHILNAVLVFWVVRKLYAPLAFPVALLFAIHPIQVETVAWVSERKNLLSLFFFLLAILAYLRFDRTRRIGHYLLTFAMFLCALLSKPIAICFIFFPVLYKWWRDGKITLREVRLSVVFTAIGFLSALYTLYLEHYHVAAQERVLNLTFLEQFIVSGRIIIFYIYKLLFPFDFMFFYPSWVVNAKIWWQWLFPLAVIFTLSSLVIYRKKIGRGAAALFIFYIISIFPVLGFLNVYGMKFSFVADHFSYLSTPCLLLLICASIYFLLRKLNIRFLSLMSLPYKIIMGVFSVTLIIYMAGTGMALTQNYKDEATFWQGIIRGNPKLWMAYNNLGVIYHQLGKIEEAAALYKKTIELSPEYIQAYSNLATAYQAVGKTEEAIALYKKAITLNPYLVEIYYNLGNAYRDTGKYEESAALYKKTIELNPKHLEAYNNLGDLYRRLGKYEEAIDSYKDALMLDSGCAQTYMNLAQVYYLGKQYILAIESYDRAMGLGGKADPNFSELLKPFRQTEAGR